MSLPLDTLCPSGPARIVGYGCSGIVSICDDDERFVLKGYEAWHGGRCYERFMSDRSKEALTREHVAYQRLGCHPNILVYGGRVPVGPGVDSLKIERALGNLRAFIVAYQAPSEQTRLNMAIQISSGMAYMHSRNIFHCDFSSRNVFVFKDWLLKVGDFGGCKIDDQEALAIEEARYRLPLRGREWGEIDYEKSDLFALGSGIYEIIAWKIIFPDMTDKQIHDKYTKREYPETDGLLGKEFMHACWNEATTAANMESALKDILADLEEGSKPKHFCCAIM